jgi:hypothetical protein
MRILIAAVVSEGILVFLAVLMQLIFNVRVHWNPGLQELGLGLTLVLPPLIGNHFLWKYSLCVGR